MIVRERGFLARTLTGLGSAGLSLAMAVACLDAQNIPPKGPPRAEVQPVVENDRVGSGDDLRVALKVHLPEGFHVNANQPRDPSLIPIVLSIDPPSGVTVSEIVYPEATDLAQRGADKPLRVYERDFAIGAVLRVGRDVAPGDLMVPARLRYQACDESMCYIPSTAVTGWTFAVAAATGPRQHREVFSGIEFGHGQAPGTATAPAAAGAAVSGPTVAVPTPGSFAKAGTDLGAAGIGRIDKFEVMGTTVGYLGSGEFLKFIHNAETGVKEAGLFEGRGPLAILLIVFLGGLALNLTPCVLPMIPINLAIIGAGVRAGSRGRGFLLGGAYGGAMAVVYGVLGLVVILTAGTFGTINSSPWFNLGIAALFVVLALAMFDVLIIDFSRFSSNVRVGESSRGSFLVAFGMGSVAALLAGACVAPVVLQVVLFSSNLYATGTRIALALPFFLGIGMAVPWPIVGAGVAALPRPGPWMVRIKQAFGIFILGTAVYYGYEAYGLFANRWVNAADVSSSVEEKLKEGWHASLAEGLATAERERKPVLIDMWATWCKNCLTMDKTTLKDESVTSALTGYVKIKFQAENPDETPAREVMQRFGTVGLPTYVILRPKT
jgi:cytochrome c biogenesis protein CcdA/thiol-disulfide isomerase/thioredoxin